MKLVSFLRVLTLSAMVFVPFAQPLAAQAAAPTGALIKGSTSSSVYYLADGKRYAFPNERVFFSWYSDFSGVMTVPDSELASYTLAGNVTYRPGVKLLKITTDPKVYAVSRYGVLRWVSSEAVATALYGSNWNTKVDDIADTFFTNYLTGAPLAAVTDFSVQNETAVTAISDNIRPVSFVPAPASPSPAPAPAAGGMITVTISSSQATLNQMLLVFANVTGNTNPISRIEVYGDQAAPLATCQNNTSCSVMYTVAQAPLSIRFRAVAYDSTGTKIETPIENQAALNVSTVSSDIKIDVTPLVLAAGSRGNFSSDAHAFPLLSSHKVYLQVPGEPNPILWKDCHLDLTCAGSTPFYRTSQLFSVVMVGGQSYVSASVTVTVNGGAPPKPVLTLVSKPMPNQAALHLDAPSGETIGWSTIVEGTTQDDSAIAICEFSSCDVTVQFVKSTSFTAFTDVGGKLEGSNTISVSP